MSLAVAREYLDLVKFHHTLFALPFALSGRCWRPGARTAGAAGRRTGSGSCSAWPRPGRRRWPSTAWSIATTTPSIPGRPAGTCRAAGSRSVRWASSPRPADWPSSPPPCSSCPIAGRCFSPSRSCSGCSGTPTPSDSRPWPISGWGPRSAWPRSPPGSRCGAGSPGRRCCWPWPCSSGSPASTSSMPARMSTSTAGSGSRACRAGWESRVPSGSRPVAMRSWLSRCWDWGSAIPWGRSTSPGSRPSLCS